METQLVLPHNEAHLWFVQLDEVAPVCLETYWDLLSDDEKEGAAATLLRILDAQRIVYQSMRARTQLTSRSIRVRSRQRARTPHFVSPADRRRCRPLAIYVAYADGPPSGGSLPRRSIA